MRAVANYGVFDVVSRTLRVGSDMCSDFGSDANGADPSHPNVENDYCFYGGQVDPLKGDCAAVTPYYNLRRFCPCSQSGKGHDIVEEHSFSLLSFRRLVQEVVLFVVLVATLTNL